MGTDRCSDCQRNHNSCLATTNHNIDVNTPIRLNPIVDIGKVKIECQTPKVCGPIQKGCECCHCKRNKSCDYVIKQTLNIEIPISYSVETDAGNSFIDCNIKW